MIITIIVAMIRAIRAGTSFSTTTTAWQQQQQRQYWRLQTTSLIIIVLLFANRSYASEDHVCFRYESYTELETVPRNQTVQVLTREWCLEIPPRCTSYRPEIKEVFVKQNVTKTRKIEFCCEGYEEHHQPDEPPPSPPTSEISNNTTTTSSSVAAATTTPIPTPSKPLTCRPICRGGCGGHGSCQSPNSCHCETGYTGKHCTQRCRNGTWGEDCKYRCHCQNYSLCDSKTGHCRCNDGWIGAHCETPCSGGFYGTLCKNRCNCNTTKCDPITGKCLKDDDLVMFENITRSMESNLSGESTERISVEQWVKVDSTTTDNGTEENNSTYAGSYREYLPADANITLIPLENITTTTEESRNETIYEIVTTTTKLEITFVEASINKIESSASQPDPTNSSAIDRDSQLIYVESNNDQEMGVEFVEDNEIQEEEVNSKQAIVTISCLLLTLALLLSVVAYMKNINKRTIKKQQQQQQSQQQIKEENSRGPDSPRILEPLPDIPKVLYTKVKGKNQRNGNTQLEHYDVPVNNTSVNKSSPYNYNFTLSKPPPGRQNLPTAAAAARKYSLEHIYDEIQYPPLSELNSGSTADDQVRYTAGSEEGGAMVEQEHFSKSILCDTKMTPVKIIDEIKGK